MLPLTGADRRILLRIARRALDERIRLQGPQPPEALPDSLEQPGGAFVTLRKASALRGCVGRVESTHPLYQTVYECSLSAALNDPRFEPVTPGEVPQLQIEVSALSPLSDITAEQVEVGRHGLVISWGEQRGLLLPQVAAEWNWDRAAFLEHACLKAGLDKDAWRRGARIQAFTADIFAEGPQMPPDEDRRT
ncbi:MAG: AmmeMemoRadiSam system protein A [Terriglobia bacterium]